VITELTDAAVVVIQVMGILENVQLSHIYGVLTSFWTTNNFGINEFTWMIRLFHVYLKCTVSLLYV